MKGCELRFSAGVVCVRVLDADIMNTLVLGTILAGSRRYSVMEL